VGGQRRLTSPAWKGRGCWRAFFLPKDEPAHNEVESRLDSNDTRMQQVVYANGKLWGPLDTALTVGGQNVAGIAWYIVGPSTAAGLSAALDESGYLGLDGGNVTYPAIGVTSSGRGVMAFTVVGPKGDSPAAVFGTRPRRVRTGACGAPRRSWWWTTCRRCARWCART
jgi:hypothetical protein